jgi:xanthine dehydrogenase small subunit
MVHGKEVITVENLRDAARAYHPVQEAMVATNGSQCGYCTPGFIMSLFALYKNHDHPSRERVEDALTGNLCRCTGYKPIIEAAESSCVHGGADHFSAKEAERIAQLDSIPTGTMRVSNGRQTYVRPASMKEALSFKEAHPEAIIVAGGTDVALRVTKNHEFLENILDLSGVGELRKIEETEHAILIGAGATLSDVRLRVGRILPALDEMLGVFGSLQIRNLATLGGNLGSASPIGDTLPVLMAYGAKVVLESLNGRREIPIDRFFTGYRKTERASGEIISSVVVPKPAEHVIVKSYKISKRRDLDISTLSACFRLELDAAGGVKSALLAYGGMAERPKRAAATERFLTGKRWEREIVEQAMKILDSDFTPISDVRGSGAMRTIAARNLLLKFWFETSRR